MKNSPTSHNLNVGTLEATASTASATCLMGWHENTKCTLNKNLNYTNRAITDKKEYRFRNLFMPRWYCKKTINLWWPCNDIFTESDSKMVKNKQHDSVRHYSIFRYTIEMWDLNVIANFHIGMYHTNEPEIIRKYQRYHRKISNTDLNMLEISLFKIYIYIGIFCHSVYCTCVYIIMKIGIIETSKQNLYSNSKY